MYQLGGQRNIRQAQAVRQDVVPLGRRQRAASDRPAGGEARTRVYGCVSSFQSPDDEHGVLTLPVSLDLPCLAWPNAAASCLSTRQEMSRGFKPRGAGNITKIDAVLGACEGV